MEKGLKGFKATGYTCHFSTTDNKGKPIKFLCKYDKGKISCAKCRNLIRG